MIFRLFSATRTSDQISRLIFCQKVLDCLHSAFKTWSFRSDEKENVAKSYIGRDGHVQPYFDEFVSFSNFHFLSPYFHPEDFENLIKIFFKCHLVVQNRKSKFYD